MRPATHKDVAAYIAGFPAPVRTVLKRVRGIVKSAVPAAEELISYQMPAYRLHGWPLLYFAAWKEHYALYPSNTRLFAAFKDELAPYEIAKGTIRFPLSKPVPVKLIDRLARFRAREIAGGLKAQTARKRPRRR